MTLEQLKNISSQEVNYMNREETLSLLKQANAHARKVRRQLYKDIEKNKKLYPPPPVTYEHGIDWKKHRFKDYKNSNKRVGFLHKKLNEVINFLNYKTVYFENWKNTVDTFVDNILSKANVVDSEGKPLTRERLSVREFKKITETYGKLMGKYGLSKFRARGYTSEQLQIMIYEMMTMNKGIRIGKLIKMIEEKTRFISDIEESKRVQEIDDRMSGFKFTRQGL